MLTQESAGKWAIQLPSDVDGNKLAQNLNDQLQKCDQKKDQWPTDANQASQAIAHSIFIALSNDQGASGSSSSTGGTSGSAGSSNSSSTGGGAASGGTGSSGTSGSTGGSSSGGTSTGR
jgi:hypothetical protein